MKILFCNTIKSWGGGEKWHYETACSLQMQGHDIALICNPMSIISQKIKDKSIHKIYSKISNLTFLNPFKFVAIIYKLNKIKPDAIIINRPAELKLIAPAAHLAGIKKIVYRRGSDVIVKNSLINRLILEKFITHIIANSSATKESLLATGLNIENKIIIIHNGVKIPSNDNHTIDNNRTPIIAAVGRLDKQKGFDMLILIADELKKRDNNFRIEIAGEGNERPMLEKMIKDRNLQQHVILKGFVNDINQFINPCSFFILTSRYEGFGYVMVEAMLAHKAVIAFNLSSVTDIVDNEKTGLLVKPFDILEFTDKIEFLIKNNDKAIKMGNIGYNKAVENYSLDKANEILLRFIQ